jgi:hypothetical protein
LAFSIPGQFSEEDQQTIRLAYGHVVLSWCQIHSSSTKPNEPICEFFLCVAHTRSYKSIDCIERMAYNLVGFGPQFREAFERAMNYSTYVQQHGKKTNMQYFHQGTYISHLWS